MEDPIMLNKRTFSIIVPVLLILAAVAFSWHNASASYKNDKSVFFGKQGIFVPAGTSGLNFNLYKINPVEYPSAPVNFKRPMLDLEYRGANGKLNIPPSMTYIIYTMTNAEMKDLEKGKLAIYYKDVLSGAWTICPTTTVAGTLNGQATTNLTCVAPYSTVYGLGKAK